MPPELDPPARPQPDVWQSLPELTAPPEARAAAAAEFPDGAGELLDPVDRRKFLALAGASAALAGAAGCNPSVRPAPQRKVVPYVRHPEQLIAGVPLFYATAMPQAGGLGVGLLVRSHEGRPVKVEGNTGHPDSLGGTNTYAQAAVLSLYDPDRSKEVVNRGVASTYDRFVEVMRLELEKQKGKQGAGVRVLSDPCGSPTLARLIGEFLGKFPKAKWVQWEPLARDNPRKAAEAAFGRPVNPVPHFDKAKVVLALDSDFLAASNPGDLRAAREFIARRKVRELEASLAAGDGVRAADMNRLYAVEPMVTCTGAVADHRLPVKPTQVEAVARAVAAKVGVPNVPAADPPAGLGPWVDACAADLVAHKGAALVVAGDGQPPAVHLLAHAINERLEAVGKTVTFTDPVEPRPVGDSLGEFRQLVADMKAGQVDLLLVLGGNPVFDAPADLDFPAALGKVRTVVHHGLYVDETGGHRHTTWHLNAAHFLETWGDVRAFDGTATVMQPLIAPLHNGKSAAELFATLNGMADTLLHPNDTDGTESKPKASDPLDVVRATWRPHYADKVKGDDYEPWWQRAVRDGVVPGTALPAVQPGAVRLAALADPAFAPPGGSGGGGLEIQFRQDQGLYDGRFANNGWLQELPRPVTNMAWDNAAIVSPRTAEELGCEVAFRWTAGERGRSEVDVVTLTLAGRRLNAAVFILPGHADGCVTLHVGHGRARAGRIGTKTGFNAYALRTTAAMYQAAGLEVAKTKETYFLACTQGQYAMEGRRPVRQATVDQMKADPDFAQVPAATPGEYKEIRELTPGTPADFKRLGLKHPFADEHGHAHHPGSKSAHTHTAAGDRAPADPDGKAHESKHDAHDNRVIPLSLYPDYPTPVEGDQASKTYRRWGMAIDLNACTGCTACVVACQAENNIPVVGKEQVTKGRALHWLRIDRYFSIPGEEAHSDRLGDRLVRGKERAEKAKESGAIKTHFQPLMCVHCEKAPCEVVCPVGATHHSADGINEMIYNRCVGTRYCSNNCPYKVRRFNFLQYADYSTESLKLLNNPEVTVRQRGVMEKCTYCIQRIRNAEIECEREHATRPKHAEIGGRPKIKDGEVVTACQAACPTGAIMFGDINDHSSRVLRWKAEGHTYGLLAEINTMPRTSYVANVRNPNPAMPKGA